MATYDELSSTDKEVVQNAVNLIRAGCGEIGRLFNHLIAIDNDSNALALVSSIDDGETIPNTSGLAGADDLTKAEVVAIWQALNTIRGANDTSANRAAWSKAAGINALLG